MFYLAVSVSDKKMAHLRKHLTNGSWMHAIARSAGLLDNLPKIALCDAVHAYVVHKSRFTHQIIMLTLTHPIIIGSRKKPVEARGNSH